MRKRVVLGIFLVGILFSFTNNKPKVKEGYYFWTLRNASTLFKIKGRKIECYSDNVMKAWRRGKYTLNEADSIMKITYDEIWESRKPNQKTEFTSSLKVKWNEAEGVFELSDYGYREKSEAIKNLIKRVKSSCKIKVTN